MSAHLCSSMLMTLKLGQVLLPFLVLLLTVFLHNFEFVLDLSESLKVVLDFRVLVKIFL